MWPNRSDCQHIVVEYMQSSGEPNAASTAADRLMKPIVPEAQQSNQPTEKSGVEVIWEAITDTACDAKAEHSDAQDRLLKLLTAIKARSPNGELANLGMTMRKRWNEAPPAMATSQWSNLNAFAARITAAQIHDFSLFALWTLRDSLEMPRARTLRETSGGEVPPKTTADAPLDELLPAAVEWLEQCGHVLFSLSQQDRPSAPGPDQPDPTWLGKLCRDAGVTQTNFNSARWKFWRKRLQEVSEARNDAGGREKIEKLAYQGVMKMDALRG